MEYINDSIYKTTKDWTLLNVFVFHIANHQHVLVVLMIIIRVA